MIFTRVGSYIRVPGVDVDRFAESMRGGGGGLLGTIDQLSGGSISRFGLFSLGRGSSRVQLCRNKNSMLVLATDQLCCCCTVCCVIPGHALLSGFIPQCTMVLPQHGTHVNKGGPSTWSW